MSNEESFEDMDMENYWGNLRRSAKSREVSVEEKGDLKEDGLLKIALMYDEIVSEDDEVGLNVKQEDEMNEDRFEEQITLLYNDIPMYDVFKEDEIGAGIGSSVKQEEEMNGDGFEEELSMLYNDIPTYDAVSIGSCELDLEGNDDMLSEKDTVAEWDVKDDELEEVGLLDSDDVPVGTVSRSDSQKHGEAVLPFKLEDEISSSSDSTIAGSIDVSNAKDESEVEEGEIVGSMPLDQFEISEGEMEKQGCGRYAPLLDENLRDDGVMFGSVKQSRSSSSSDSSYADGVQPQSSDLSKNLDVRELIFAMRNANGVKSEYHSATPSQCQKNERLDSLGLQSAVVGTLPNLVQLQDSGESQEPMLLEEIEGSFNKVSMQRISAQRTFPPGCGWQALIEIMGGCEQSVQNFIENMLGDKSSTEENMVGKIAGANAKQRREEVEDRDACRGKLRGNRRQEVRMLEYEHVRKGFDGKLRHKYAHECTLKLSRRNNMPRLNINPPFFSKRLDRRDRYSHREFGVKSFNVNNDRRTKRRFPVKSQYERQNVNQFHLEKHVAMRPSTERAIVQALMAAPNCPWRQGRDTFTSQDKTSKYIPTNCYNEYEDYFPVQGEASDSPYVKNILNRDPNATTFASDSRDDDIKISIARNKVRKTLRLFQILCRILLRDEEGKSKGFSAMRQTVLMAATILIENKKWINSGQQVMGPVPGVEIGDEFRYRVELAIVGLHQSYESEIDYIDSGGKKLATSIIASGSYDEFLDSSDILVYSGQGGNSTCGTKVTADQKLVGGNLALRNSKDERTPIRVIRGFREASSLDSKQNITTLVYDGLYLVEEYWKEKQTYGNIVFMFKLRRIHGQPELAIKQVKRMRKTSVRERVCVPDISRGTEMIPIAAVNTINNEAPRSFEYITRMNYSQCDKPTSPQGCNCVGGCFSSRNCSCIMKNGGRIPFNYNGAIVETMALVYECGPQCRCPPSCYNKVSQRGIKFSLEVFKTKSKGWGVRSLSSIPSGSFICEYRGKLLNEKEAGQMIGKDDEYLFNTGCSSKNDDALWEGLSDLLPSELRSSTSCKAVGYPGLAVDASQYGNIGRFINHSCSPNLYMQSILYDHHDRRMPHLMLFAAENIPPLQELTSNYNMGLDRVRDGNVRKFKCYCGSSECTGIGY